MTRFNLNHFKKCLNIILQIFGKVYKVKPANIPTSTEFFSLGKVEFLSLAKALKELNAKTQKSPIKKRRKSSPKKPVRTQKGGNRVFNFLKVLITNVLGIANPEDYGTCAYIETLLNILVWTAFLYAMSVPALGTIGISLYAPATLMEFLREFSAPHDYIISLLGSILPEIPDVVREATVGRLIEFGTRIWTDYNAISLEEGGTIFFIIAKLIRINSTLYEGLFILPIICSIATIYEPCRLRCN